MLRRLGADTGTVAPIGALRKLLASLYGRTPNLDSPRQNRAGVNL